MSYGSWREDKRIRLFENAAQLQGTLQSAARQNAF